LPTKVTVPKLGLTMTEGTVVEWIKKEGDSVEKGKPLFSLDTQKVTVEVESPVAGVLRRIIAPEGTTVPIGGLVAIITDPNESVIDLDELSKEAPKPLTEHVTVQQDRMSEQPRIVSPEVLDRVPISPSARKLAREQNLDISRLKGRGQGGRIQREDVLKAIEEIRSGSLEAGSSNIETAIPLNAKRHTIIDRLTASYSNALHVTLQLEADFAMLKAFREEFLAQHGGKRLSYTDLLVKAAALALREIRLLNSTIEGDQIRIFKNVNIGIAVSLDNGLVVPVLKNVDRKTLGDIATETENLIGRARSGKLTLDDVTGGTFTITNLGMYHVDSFIPIINPPEAAILAVGRTVDKPVVVDGQICIRPMGILTLTFDHRIVDGAGASEFLREISKIIANPSLLT
jgi:pyruvate dehydrogenase E2 component (dihydrolipoamide acetyltransferase)